MKEWSILTIITILAVIAEAFIDAYIIKIKWGKIKSLNHPARVVARLFIFAIAAYFLGYTVPVDYVISFIKSLKKPFVAGLYCFFLFGALFDPLLNILRKKEWYYKGKDAISDQVSWLINKKELVSIAFIELSIEIILAGLCAWVLLI